MDVVVRDYFRKMENVGDQNSVLMIESDVFVRMNLNDLVLVPRSVRTISISASEFVVSVKRCM